MAGFMTKLSGYLYEGELVNGMAAPVENGLLLAHGKAANVGKLVAPAVDTAVKFLCKEVASIYDGMTAYRFVVTGVGAAPLYFVENGFDINESEAYDTTKYTTAVGELLRAHPLHVGEEFVTNMVDGTPVAGTEYTIKATGKIG